MSRHLTVPEVADELGLRPDQIRKLIRCGDLPAHNVAATTARNPVYRVSRSQLDGWLRARETVRRAS